MDAKEIEIITAKKTARLLNVRYFVNLYLTMYISIRIKIDKITDSKFTGDFSKSAPKSESCMMLIFGIPNTLLSCETEIISAAAEVKPTKTCSGILSKIFPALISDKKS